MSANPGVGIVCIDNVAWSQQAALEADITELEAQIAAMEVAIANLGFAKSITCDNSYNNGKTTVITCEIKPQEAK